MLRTLALAVASTAALISSLAPATAAPAQGISGTTQVVYDCQHEKQEPRKIVPACADFGDYAVVRQWSSWTSHQARGSGTFVLNDCKPNCAAGTFRHYSATFSLHEVVNQDGTRLFTRLGVTYVKNGEQRNLNLPLPTAPITG